jgi:hypothetical protein
MKFFQLFYYLVRPVQIINKTEHFNKAYLILTTQFF